MGVVGREKFWLGDAEMLAIAMVPVGKKVIGVEGELKWGKVKIGQLVVIARVVEIVEGMGKVQENKVCHDFRIYWLRKCSLPVADFICDLVIHSGRMKSSLVELFSPVSRQGLQCSSKQG